MKCNPVGWFEIYVQDMARAKAFYEKVLQVKLEKVCCADEACCQDMEMVTFPMENDACGAGGALVKKVGVHSGCNSTVVYFCCEDCAVEESRAVANGGCVEQTKMPIGEYGFISLVVDTDGNRIGLHSLK